MITNQLKSISHLPISSNATLGPLSTTSSSILWANLLSTFFNRDTFFFKEVTFSDVVVAVLLMLPVLFFLLVPLPCNDKTRTWMGYALLLQNMKIWENFLETAWGGKAGRDFNEGWSCGCHITFPVWLPIWPNNVH